MIVGRCIKYNNLQIWKQLSNIKRKIATCKHFINNYSGHCDLLQFAKVIFAETLQSYSMKDVHIYWTIPCNIAIKYPSKKKNKY